MRIAYLSTFYPYRGGIAQFNAALLRTFAKKGHQTKAFTFTRQYPSILFPGKTQYASANDTSEDVHAVRVLDTVNPFTFRSAAYSVMEFKPDIMLTKYWMPFFAPSLGMVGRELKKHGIVNIAVLDNVIPHEKKFYDALLTRYFLRSYHGFIAMSKSVAEDVRSFIPDAKVKVHPHPMYDFGDRLEKSDAKHKLGLSESDNYILFFGFIRRYKGLDLLLEAMAKIALKNKNFKLLVAGEFYGDSSYYLNKIDEYGLRDKVILHTDYIPTERVRYYFCAADMVVQPYRSATQSGVTQIAYHFEKPMLVTDVGGLAEIIPNRKVGYVVKPSAVEIATALTDFYEHKAERETTFTAGCRDEKKHFQWESFAEAIEKLYKEIKG